MLEFFKSKKNHFIGIDFGTSSIKVVELSYKDQAAHLENYGVVDLNLTRATNTGLGNKSASYEQKLNGALKKLLEKMDISGGRAFVAIPGFSGLITIIELPDMEETELSKAIQFEAHKYIPSSLDEVAMSWEIVERFTQQVPAAGGQAPTLAPASPASTSMKKVKVLLVAAPKRDIDRYDGLIAGANLEVNAIELETFSIARSLVADEVGNFFIIDIGAQATNIILVENGIVRVNRNIDAGGNEITSAICESMSISRQRADAFKRGDKDFLNGKEAALIIPVLELIVGESQRILNAYREKNKQTKIEEMILSGGSSGMKGLDQYFSTALGMKVKIGNPWRRVTSEEKVQPLVKKLGCSFAVAIGLALRGIDEHKRQ